MGTKMTPKARERPAAPRKRIQGLRFVTKMTRIMELANSREDFRLLRNKITMKLHSLKTNKESLVAAEKTILEDTKAMENALERIARMKNFGIWAIGKAPNTEEYAALFRKEIQENKNLLVRVRGMIQRL